MTCRTCTPTTRSPTTSWRSSADHRRDHPSAHARPRLGLLPRLDHALVRAVGRDVAPGRDRVGHGRPISWDEATMRRRLTRPGWYADTDRYAYLAPDGFLGYRWPCHPPSPPDPLARPAQRHAVGGTRRTGCGPCRF